MRKIRVLKAIVASIPTYSGSATFLPSGTGSSVNPTCDLIVRGWPGVFLLIALLIESAPVMIGTVLHAQGLSDQVKSSNVC